MLDILKTAAGQSLLPLLAWIFPSALAVLALWFITLPMLGAAGYSVPAAISGLTSTAAVSWLTGVSIAFGAVLNVMSTPLYRFLEGYSWPPRLRQRAVDWQKRKYQKLLATVEAGISGQQWETGLALERLARYPSDVNQIAPACSKRKANKYETRPYSSDAKIGYAPAPFRRD